jgi:hypothetical protein
VPTLTRSATVLLSHEISGVRHVCSPVGVPHRISRSSAEAAAVRRARSLCSAASGRRPRAAEGLHCHEQHLAGQGGRGGQRVEEEPARDGIVAYRPQQQAVVPGQIPGGVDRPGGGQAGHRS